MFTKQFDSYVCDGDKITCEVDGFKCLAFVERDDNCDSPEDRDNGFWPSLDPDAAGYIGDKSELELEVETAKAAVILHAWRCDEWDYCGVCVVVSRKGVRLTGKYANASWGIERNYPGSDNSYLACVANELLGEAIDQAKVKLADLCSA